MITLTDSTGCQYRFSGAEEKLLQPLLDRNAEARRQLIIAIVEFDNRRLKLLTDVVAGRPTPGYGLDHARELMPATHTPAAIHDIRREYDASIAQLREVLGEGMDAEIESYRSLAFVHPRASELELARLG